MQRYLIGGVGVVAVSGLLLASLWSAPALSDGPKDGTPNASNGLRTVRAFGAAGDGKTDDTAAIQRAVDAGVGDIVFPRGVYRISQPIVVQLNKVGPTSVSATGTARIVMSGAGPAIKFVGTHGGTAAPHTFKPQVWEHERTPMVDGIEIVGAHPEAIGIEATGTMQAIFTRVTVRKALHGIHLTKRNRNVLIADCHLYENRGIGLFLDHLNLHQINVVNSHISYNDGGGMVVRDSEIRNLQIATCDIEGNMGEKSEPTANILIDTTNGSVREGAIVGCTIQHTHQARDSANIRFIGRSREVNQKVGHFAISDNALSDVGVNIHLKYARGVTITGNTLWKGFAHDLLVEGSSNIVLGPNLFDRNPDYRPTNSSNGILFRETEDCTITGLHVTNVSAVNDARAGLTLEKCRWINVTGCSVLDCDNCAILLNDCHYCRVSNCLIRDTRENITDPVAIRMNRGKDNIVTDNLVSGKIVGGSGDNDTSGNRSVTSPDSE